MKKRKKRGRDYKKLARGWIIYYYSDARDKSDRIAISVGECNIYFFPFNAKNTLSQSDTLWVEDRKRVFLNFIANIDHINEIKSWFMKQWIFALWGDIFYFNFWPNWLSIDEWNKAVFSYDLYTQAD